MIKKTAKNTAAVSSFAADFVAVAEKHLAQLALLTEMDVSAMGEHDLKQHRAAMLAERNRATRCNAFAKLLANDSFAAAFVQFGLTVAAVQRLQIYAQDKLQATLQAIAANRALSSIAAGNHSNNMTQRLIAALDADGELTISNAPRRMHDLHPDKTMGTYSAQASSSRQVLELLGMIKFDALTKAFKLSETGEEYRAVIAH